MSTSTTNRAAFIDLFRLLTTHPAVEIVPGDECLLRGQHLFERRPDKAWSLTDCISFAVMTDRGLTDPLTGDRHFEQAGFRALLRQV